MPVIPAFVRQRQAEFCGLEASLTFKKREKIHLSACPWSALVSTWVEPWLGGLRAQATFAEDSGSVPNAHMMAHNWQ